MIKDDEFSKSVLESLSSQIKEPVTTDQYADTLAEIGLDSLGTLRWRQQLTKEFGVQVPLAALGGSSTVAEVVSRIQQETTLDGDESFPEHSAPPEPAELTVVQQAYWAGRGDDFHGGGVATFWYHEYERDDQHRAGRDLLEDLARVETAWKRLVARHPMLRTTIGRDARPRIARHDVRDWCMPRHDLRALDAEQAEQEALQIRYRLSHQVRPTDQWPVVDVVAVLLPGDRVRLCLGFDALLVDFASWGTIMREWGMLVHRPHTRLTPLPVTFADALRERTEDPQRRRRRALDRGWWQRQQIPPAPLPQAVFPEKATRFRRHCKRIPAPEWMNIVRQARRLGISSTAVVLTAFAIACQRWGRNPQEGLTVNLTVFDRPEGFEGVVGDFSTTALLPLTVENGFQPQLPHCFTELATAVQHRLFEVLDHHSYGGIEVARDRPESGPWPVVFTSGLGQSSGVDDRWLGERIFGVSQTPQVLWDHLVWEEDEALVLTHDVIEGAVAQATVEGLIEMEIALLSSLQQMPGWERPAPGWDPRAEVMPAARRRTDVGPLLHDPWSATKGETAAALLWTDGEISHAELRKQADGIAAALRNLGVGAGVLVLIVLPKGPRQIAAVLGTMLAGAGYVPADPTWPLARLTAIRERTGLHLAITTDDVTLPDGVSPVPIPVEGSLETVPRPEESELAYVIFTSGSTGTPKGVAIEHRQARTTIDEINARFEVVPSDRVLALSALSFDLSVYDIFGVLGAGGALVLPEAERLRDPQHWLELMAQHHVTLWNSAPPMMEMLLEYAESVPEQARAAFSSLRHCLLSGDWIPVTLPDRLRALAPGAQVHSLGGATEASIWSITYQIERVDPDWSSIPYGRALPGQSFWILDEHGSPKSVGEPGELYIGGAGVARGYIGAEKLTAERFIDRSDLGTRLYRTGDLGRWREDGQIEFLGRVDRQVKIGGHRIELGEIEAALSRLVEVRQGVASSMPGPDGRPRLVAHVVPDNRDWLAFEVSERRRANMVLAEALREHLPNYMIPGRFVLLDRIPTTENGKIDHQSLRNPYVRASVESDGAAEEEKSLSCPEAQAEGTVDLRQEAAGLNSGRSSLRQLVLEVLGSEVTLQATLAGNGATSLQLVRIANLVEDHGLPRPRMSAMLSAEPLGVLLDKWQELLETDEESGTCRPSGRDEPDMSSLSTALIGDPASSLSSMAARLRRAADLLEEADQELGVVSALLGVLRNPRAGDSPRPPAPLTTDSRQVSADESFELTEMQLAYLLGRAPDGYGRVLAPHFYTEALVRQLEPERLHHAWEVLLDRHPMLRATITEDTRQRVGDLVDVPLDLLDQRGLSGTEQQRRRERIREERSHRQLPVSRAPMLRMLAVRLDEEHWRVHLDLDLLFYDADSAVILMEELAALYENPQTELPELEGSFATWVRTDTPSDEAKRYWAAAIRNLPDPVVPPVQKPDDRRAGHFARRRHEMDAEQWRRIRRYASERDVTTTCLLLDALGDVLAPHGAGTVMLTVSRRPTDQAGVVGDFTATMPVAIGGRAGGLTALQAGLAEALEATLLPGGVHGNSTIRMLRAAGREANFPVAVSCSLGPTRTDASQLLDIFGRTEYAISQTPQVLVDVQLFEVAGRFHTNIDADESIVSPEWLDELHAAWIARLAQLAGIPSDRSFGADAARVRADVEAVFSELLGGVRIESRQSWFEQGASSVTLVSAQRLLRQRGYELDVIDLFAHPTPAGTVAHLLGRKPETTSGDISPALAAARRRGQRRRAAR